MTAYERLSRTAMLRRRRSSGAENIPDSPNCVQHRLIFIDLAAQPVDQHVDHVGLRIEAIIEDMFEDHRFGHRTVGMAHEVLEQGKLAWLKLNFFRAAPDFAAEQV